MLCEKCNKIIDKNSQYCKYCGHEHLLKKPFNPSEYRKETGIYIDLRSDAEERLTEQWQRYNEQQARIQNGEFNKKERPLFKNFFKEVNIYNLGLFIVGIMLFIAIFQLPYFYYRLLRAVLCVFSFYIGVSNNTALPVRIFLILSAILFNPIEPFTFEKETWIKIDIVFGIIYLLISFTDHFTKINLTRSKEG